MISERPCLVDGRPCDLGGLPDGLYVSQNIRTAGTRALHIGRHFEVLDSASATLLGFGVRTTPQKLSKLVSELLDNNGYPADSLSYITVRQYLSGELLIAANEIFPYRERGLRVWSPRAGIADFEIPFSEVQSSLSESAVQIARLGLQRDDAEVRVVLRRNVNGEIVSADGAPLFIVKDGLVTAPQPAVPSAEYDAACRAVLASGLPLADGEIDTERLLDADELFFADHRGMTAVSSCADHVYMHLLAARIARYY